MGNTRLRRPSAPTAAERARSLVARGGTASLVGTSRVEPVAPRMLHVRADGSAVLLLGDDEPLLTLLRSGEEPAVMLELADRAPIPLREPVRGLLWILGRLWLPDPRAARRTALQVLEEAQLRHSAETMTSPVGRRRTPPTDEHSPESLLDLGHGATLVRLDPGSAVLADGDGSAALGPADLAAARPDPFCRVEDHWLPHLEACHPEVLVALTRHLPPGLRGPATRVRPLGVDRCGLRLRVETARGDHDVRLAFAAEATTPAELRTQVHRLVGCPRRPA